MAVMPTVIVTITVIVITNGRSYSGDALTLSRS